MLRVVLSPSKAMDFRSPCALPASSTPRFLEESERLVERMQQLNASRLATLMKLSPALSELNAERYARFHHPETPQRQAMLAFKGDTYKDIPLERYSEQDFIEAQRTVRILSGLYGWLRPLDLIAPHRLEMGTRLETERGANLYAFWGSKIRRALREELDAAPKESHVLVHCASAEYFKALEPKALDVRIIQPIFKEQREDGEFKTIALYAKRARGMMADFIVRGRLQDPEAIRGFDRDGYVYDEAGSTPDRPLFLRRQRG